VSHADIFLPSIRNTFKCLMRGKLPNLLGTGTSRDSIRVVNQVRVGSPGLAAGYLLLDSHVNHENTQPNHTTWFVRPKRQRSLHPPCQSHVTSSPAQLMDTRRGTLRSLKPGSAGPQIPELV
jgi:hypothetical protein